MDELPKVGDSVSVDLTGMYLAICQRCGETTLVVPGGTCAECHAPESEVIRQPFEAGETIEVDADELSADWEDE